MHHENIYLVNVSKRFRILENLREKHHDALAAEFFRLICNRVLYQVNVWLPESPAVSQTLYLLVCTLSYLRVRTVKHGTVGTILVHT